MKIITYLQPFIFAKHNGNLPKDESRFLKTFSIPGTPRTIHNLKGLSCASQLSCIQNPAWFVSSQHAGNLTSQQAKIPEQSLPRSKLFQTLSNSRLVNATNSTSSTSKYFCKIYCIFCNSR